MEPLIIVLLSVLVVAVVVVGVRLGRPQTTPEPTTPTIVAPPIDIAPIVEAVKAAIDVNAISTGVQGAVETKIHQAATDVLNKTSEEARRQADERLKQQQSAVEDQTKLLMQPFAQAMEALNTEVTKLRDQNAEKFGSVDNAVTQLASQTQALNNVLSSAQGRGNWGERMLEDILFQSGLERGINYERQEILVDGGRPDYSFFLPEDRVLYLDSKFPLENYVKYFEAADENARTAYRNSFIKNVEDRVKELEKRDYVSQSKGTALDYVLLFIPNEGVLSFIQQYKPSLIDEAVAKKVVLCSPLTLYAFLGVVRQATDSFHMEQNAREILVKLTSFSKAWAQYVKNLTEIYSHFEKMQKKLKAVTTGRVMTSLRRPIREIEELAKARQVVGSDETLKEITLALEEAEQDLDEAPDDE